MAKLKETVGEFVAEAVATAIGWAFSMALLGGAYGLGSWLAPHFGGGEHREAFGILSAITLIWLYEHRRANERWTRLLARDA